MKKRLKQFYVFLPFKKTLFRFIRFFGTPPERIFRHLHFKGIIKVKTGAATSFRMHHYGFQIENEIFWAGLEGGWEKESFRLWTSLCRKSEVILDIGANTGVYSLIACSVNPSARVYAFEPVKRVYEKLLANIRLNGFNIVAEELAVSDRDGTAVIYDSDDEHTLSVTVNKKTSQHTQKEVSIRIERLDSFIQRRQPGKTDLVKIDVETHEPEVLAGFGQYLADYRPTILIEVLNEEIAGRIMQLTSGMGYLYFNIDERGGIKQTERIMKSDYFNYLLCSETVAREQGLIA